MSWTKGAERRGGGGVKGREQSKNPSSFTDDVQVQPPEWCFGSVITTSGKDFSPVPRGGRGVKKRKKKRILPGGSRLSQLHLQDLTIMLESCSTLGVRPE